MHEKTTKGWRFDPNALTARDVLIIVPLVLVTLVLFAAFAFQVNHDTYIRWGGLVLNTAIIFGFFISYSSQYLRKMKFWTLTICFLTVHAIAWIIFLEHVGEWKLSWFSVMVFELPVFWYLRDRPGLLT
jgi:hypothetical protein